MRSPEAVPPALDSYLRAHLQDTVEGPLSWARLSGGRSNISMLVSDGWRRWVLRRPPEGHILPTAHDVSREYRVQAALQGSGVPVARTHSFTDDPAPLGVPFYVMDFVDGPIFRTASDSAALDLSAARATATGLVHTLAALHGVDHRAVGLGGLGRPEGFLARNVARWVTQLSATRTVDSPDLDRAVAFLEGRLPETRHIGIVHGDYRLDNVVMDETRTGRVAAILDWEMATVGDTLTDLGLLMAYWGDREGPEDPLTRGQTTVPGFPDVDDVPGIYAEVRDVDLADLPWYVAFACFKVYVVVEGLVTRARAGHSPDADPGELEAARDLYLRRTIERTGRL